MNRRASEPSTIKTIESHAAGEPLRIVTEGWPAIPGRSMLAKRRYAREHHDHLRRLLMREPRGHSGMYGAILTKPVTDDGDFGVLFMHNEGFSTMCGHGVIALVTSLIETGMVPARGGEKLIRLDTPAGRVTAKGRIKAGEVESVSFENVPSFVLAVDQRVGVEGLGTISYDLAFGGAFYAYCGAEDLGVGLLPSDSQQLTTLGMRVKEAVMERHEIRHPIEEDLGFLYGTIICGRSRSSEADLRNVCVFADGQIDRSPTGTGVSGHVALRHAKAQMPMGKKLKVESITGTVFSGTAVRETKVGGFRAVVPRVEGSAWTTGSGEYWLDPRDPLTEGFLLS